MNRPLRLLASGALHLGLLLTVVLGAVGGLLQTVVSTEAIPPVPLLLGTLAVGGVVILCLAAYKTRAQSRTRFALGVLVGTFLAHVVYTAAIDQPLISDFDTMWSYAQLIAESGYQPPAAGSIQEMRALPYLAPLAVVTRGWDYSYQLANSLALTLAALVAYLLANFRGGRRAALVALVLAAFAAEPFMASEIATHDIPGALFALFALLLAELIHRSLERDGGHPRLTLLALLLGLTIFLTTWQRGTGVFLLVAIAISVALSPFLEGGKRRCWGQVIFLILIPMSVAFSANRLSDRLFLDQQAGDGGGRGTWRWVAAYANSESVGDLDDFYSLRPLLATLGDEEVRDFAIARTLSDFLDTPHARPVNYARRLMPLYYLGSQYWFYVDDTGYGVRSRPTRLLPTQGANAAFGSVVRSYTELFRIGFLFTAGLAITILLFGRARPPGFYRPLLFVAVLTASLALLGESQARYMFPVWFILPIYIGQLAAEQGPRLRDLKQTVRVRLAGLGLATLAALGLLFIAYFLANLVLPWENGRFLPSKSFVTEGNTAQAGKYALEFGEGDGQSESARLALDGVGRGSYSFSAFVTKGESEGTCCATLQVLLSGNLAFERILTFATVEHIWFDGLRVSDEVETMEVRVETALGVGPVTVSYMSLRGSEPE